MLRANGANWLHSGRLDCDSETVALGVDYIRI
jgi:hypothetical protein